MFKEKKVLLVGLGILGGGVATANFLIKEGANLTITDLKNKKELKNTLNKLINKKVKLTLGGHKENDFKDADIIVFNPAVPPTSPSLKLAKKLGKQIENDLTLFLKSIKQKETLRYIGLTGTRGKTTTTTWLSKIIPNAVLGGNIPERALFKIIDKKGHYVLELSSAQLEFVNKNTLAPYVSIITNIYNDHLNRYKSFKHYIDTKSLIFKNQTKDNYLILNKDNKYSSFFLKKKPKSQIYYFSLFNLPTGNNGLFFVGDKIIFQEKGKKYEIIRLKGNFALHHKSNLLAAMLAAYLFGLTWSEIIKKIKVLPKIPFRQQVIFQKNAKKIINDSAATSPDATMAAIDFFKKEKNLILITGGTDKNLDFNELVYFIKKNIKKENLYLFSGSATIKIIDRLKKINYLKARESIKIYNNLNDILFDFPVKKYKEFCLLFSPASASFEKFKNEFDRGRKFNNLIKKFLKIWKI